MDGSRCNRSSTNASPRARPQGVRRDAGPGPLAESAVEAIDEGILVGLARLDVSKHHAAEFDPLGECFAQKLRAVVRP